MMRLFSACLVFAMLLFSCSTTLAASHYPDVSGGQINEALANTPHARFMPPNPLYFAIRFKELVARFFTASAVNRAEFDFLIATKRLNEGYLLFDKGHLQDIESSLESYGGALQKSVSQLKKARSQNQEIVPAVDKIVADLKYQEVLLLALIGKTEGSNYSFAVEGGIGDFNNFVEELEKIKPGVKSRFKLSSWGEDIQTDEKVHFPSATPSATFEPTASASPKRVIF